MTVMIEKSKGKQSINGTRLQAKVDSQVQRVGGREEGLRR
jgi:hypothetical protein